MKDTDGASQIEKDHFMQVASHMNFPRDKFILMMVRSICTMEYMCSTGFKFSDVIPHTSFNIVRRLIPRNKSCGILTESVFSDFHHETCHHLNW